MQNEKRGWGKAGIRGWGGGKWQETCFSESSTVSVPKSPFQTFTGIWKARRRHHCVGAVGVQPQFPNPQPLTPASPQSLTPVFSFCTLHSSFCIQLGERIMMKPQKTVLPS